MRPKGARAWRYAAIGTLVLACAGCDTGSKLPSKGSKDYADAVSAFYSSLAALQVGDDVHAERRLTDLTRLAPGEPAGWTNWGVLALRQRNFDVARTRLERATEAAPKDARIHALLGILESNRGRSPQAIAELTKAVELDPRDLRSSFALAQEIERQGGSDSEAQYQQAIQKILSLQADNLAAQLELARIAAKRNDLATLKSAVGRIGAQSSAWPPEAKEQLAVLHQAAERGDVRAAATRTTLLRNVLLRVPEFRQSFAALKAAPGEEAQPLPQFLKLDVPAVKPAPSDTALRFENTPVAAGGNARWGWIGAIDLGSGGAPVVAVANGSELRLASGASLPFPGGAAKAPPSPEGVLQLDFNYDFKTDLVLAGAGGLRFYRQEAPDAFVDVTDATGLPPPIRDRAYAAAWALDLEADGDLDLVLATTDGAVVVLRNNGDGSFQAIDAFAGLDSVRQLAWADLDNDGTSDIAVVDAAGRLRVYNNERQGQFRERTPPIGDAQVKAIAIADANNDGVLDLVAVKADGAIVRISDRNEGKGWEVAELAKVPNASATLAGDVRLYAADLDNNGAIDLVLAQVGVPSSGAPGAGALIWLGNEKNEYALLSDPAGPAAVFAAADVGNDGKLELLGLSPEGLAQQGHNRGAKSYHWQVVRPRAAQAFGDQRINPFGIGGNVEIRAGSLVQKQPITGPQLHFGLGESAVADVIRVIWPNGAVRAEFDVKADQDVLTEQRLKGSCPFLFAYNGKDVEFVKDAVPWGSAIGLRINTLGSAAIAATEEWYKVGRDQLVPRDGYYDLRITAELWEVYYYDRFALMTVDHPEGTEIYVDERFVIPPAKLAITTVRPPRKVARATDDTGRDVTDVVAALDGRAVYTFGQGQYQGVTREHYLEVDLGADAPASGPLVLLAHGSLYPTDSSINVAISQGTRWRAQSLSLEVPDGRGGWIVARENLGFPAGRKKTMVIDLDGVFPPGAARRVRLRTNLEIYWDQIEWAIPAPDASVTTKLIDPTVADLHYRGYSVIERPDQGSPELPDYNRLAGSKQRWRDLIGYYTRFGDVRELLARADDRYVIMNAGDEMSFRFPEQPAPAKGYLRDFVVVGDGWIKDGDYNSTFSKTVLPLPYHAQREYETPPGRLEDEIPYKQYPEDWQTYHTRYVTPDAFNYALRSQARR